jgi:hypothetical protein
MQLSAKSSLITLLLTGVVSLLVVVGIHLTLVRPRRAELTKLAGEVEAKEKQQTDAVAASREAAKNALHADCEAAMTDLATYVIHPDDRMDVAMAVGELAKAAGISDFSDTYRPPVPGMGSISTYVIEVRCKASYPQLAKFIQSLESNRPIIFVDTFSISYASMRNARHDVSMTLTVLVRPEDELGQSLEMYVPDDDADDAMNHTTVMEDAHGG